MAPSRRIAQSSQMRGAASGRNGRMSASLPRIRTASTEGTAYGSASAVDARCGLEVGVVSAQGRRPYQEDEYVVRPILRPRGKAAPETHTALFGIYDGHAGGRCSKAVAGTLPDILLSQNNYFDNIGSALQAAYNETNKEFLKVAERLKLHDGSTGITSVLRGMKLTVANVGDCRAVLVRGGVAKQISVDHKPTDPVEMNRISALGGQVVHCMGIARVNGVLAVSRAFGNRSLKKVIRPDADIFSVPLVPEDEYLVQASDGMWDVLSNADVSNICHKFSAEGPQRIAQELVSAALGRGSTDNTTAMVVLLQEYVARQLKSSSKLRTGRDRTSSYESDGGISIGGGEGDVADNGSNGRNLSRFMGEATKFLSLSRAGSPTMGSEISDSNTADMPSPKKIGFLDMLWADRDRNRSPSPSPSQHSAMSTGSSSTASLFPHSITSPIQAQRKGLHGRLRPGTTHGGGRASRQSMLMQDINRSTPSPITVPNAMRRPNTRGGF